MPGETVLNCNGDSLFFSAPASPTHFLLSSSPLHSAHSSIATCHLEQADFEFGLVARSMSTAEELFFNGQIRPGFVSTDQTPLSHTKPVHRRTRSVSPTRSPLSHRKDQRKASAASLILKAKPELFEAELNPNMASETARSYEFESVSASTSRSSSSNSSSSSSSNANSRRWEFIKDFLSLQRSKSEGGLLATAGAGAGSRLALQRKRNSTCTNGSGRMAYSSSFRPGLYKEHKAEVDGVKEMRRRMTFLPYKQQWFLFGCLGLTSTRLTRNAGIATVSARHN